MGPAPDDPLPAPPAGRPWPADWPHGDPAPPPDAWGRPGLALLFHLECAGCVSRAVPFLKRLHAERGDALAVLAVHTAYGRRALERERVVPQLTRFAARFARLPFPVALDPDGSFARAWGAEGTPHWLAFGADGRLERSVFGSQDNARTRLEYWIEEALAGEG